MLECQIGHGEAQSTAAVCVFVYINSIIYYKLLEGMSNICARTFVCS